MEVVFIIGNGFDINLGMKTRYSDFLTYYQSVKSSSEAVNNLKKEISKDFYNWSDLELALGRYTEKNQTFAEFEEAFEDIGEELAKYLQKEEDDFDFDRVDKQKLFNYLANPVILLPPEEKRELDIFKSNKVHSNIHVNIITFNYTQSLEHIIKKEQEILIIGKIMQYFIILESIEHIHGYVDKRMIMGVNDTTQVSNSLFHKNQNFLEAFVKEHCNQANKYQVDTLCSAKISKANLICIFGSSLGDTDNMWWELIGDKIREHNCYLIIFYKTDDIPDRIAHKKEKFRREVKELFLNKLIYQGFERKSIEEKIFVGVNTGIFDF